MASLYGEIFGGGFIARGTKVLKQLPVRKIDFDNHNERLTHESIADSQKKLIQMGDEIDAAHGNKRQLTILQRQFDIAKQELDDYSSCQRNNLLTLSCTSMAWNNTTVSSQ